MPGRFLERVRAAGPRVHCIANYVTANDCANLLLAVGASPVMADDPLESAQVTACCNALALSLGTLSDRKLQAMLLSCVAAGRKGIPVVLDPVGVTVSPLRRDAAKQLLDTGCISVIRGNASEIRLLAGEEVGTCGLEADAETGDECAAARHLAQQTNTVVVMTGKTDIITDGKRLQRVHNGHEILRAITGAGCQLSAMLGAFAGANPKNLFDASVSAVCMMGLCGEIAHARMTRMDGNSACRGYIIDAAYRMTEKQLTEGARYES